MLKGKNLWIVLGVGAAAYYIWWMKMKKDKASKVAKAALATTPGSESNFTGDLSVPTYQNATGVPKFGKSAMYPSGMNQLGNRLSGF